MKSLIWFVVGANVGFLIGAIWVACKRYEDDSSSRPGWEDCQ